MEETKSTIDIANEHIGWIIRDEALVLGYDEFFKKFTLFYKDGKDYESPRALAKEAVHNLPDYCSFDAFYACFEDRFKTWHETGYFDGIVPDPDEE